MKVAPVAHKICPGQMGVGEWVGGGWGGIPYTSKIIPVNLWTSFMLIHGKRLQNSLQKSILDVF